MSDTGPVVLWFWIFIPLVYEVYRGYIVFDFSVNMFVCKFFFGNFFIAFFSGTVRPTKLKLSTHVHNGWMYRVYQNQAIPAYSSLYFFIFLSLQFANIKCFFHTFLRNYEPYKIESRYTGAQRLAVSCILESDCCCFLFIPLFLHFPFTPIFKH